MQRLSHNEEVNAGTQQEQCSPAVICPQDLADTLTYCIFIYNSHIDKYIPISEVFMRNSTETAHFTQSGIYAKHRLMTQSFDSS